MKNKDIVNFSKFFESDFTSKPSSFKKEDFNDFFLAEEAEKEDDKFLVNTFDEIEKTINQQNHQNIKTTKPIKQQNNKNNKTNKTNKTINNNQKSKN
jgi:hypothetical protein